MVFSPDGKYIASGSGGPNEGTVKVWRLEIPQTVHNLEGHTKEVFQLPFHQMADSLLRAV